VPAVDTNLLVRYVVRDNEAQLLMVQDLVRDCIRLQQSLYVPVTVALELEWVLRSSFGYDKNTVMGVLSDLLCAAELRFESERALEVALHQFRNGRAEFADCVHVALAMQAGEAPLWTFDKAAAKISGARLL